MTQKAGFFRNLIGIIAAFYKSVLGMFNTSWDKHHSTLNPDQPAGMQETPPESDPPDVSQDSVATEPDSSPANQPIRDKPAADNKQQPDITATPKNDLNQIPPTDPETAAETYENLITPLLDEYLDVSHAGQSAPEFENDPDFAAERDARIAANKERIAALKRDMISVIAEKADRIALRKKEIEDALTKNSVNVARLETERAEMVKHNLADAEAKLAELTKGIERNKQEAMRLTMERELLIETLTLKNRKKTDFRSLISHSTEAVQHARAIAAKRKATDDKRTAELRETLKLKRNGGAPSDAGRTQRTTADNDTRIEQLKKDMENRHARIRGAAAEKARREAERQASLAAERQARLEAAREKVKSKRQKRK